jgi:hypothetical protein
MSSVLLAGSALSAILFWFMCFQICKKNEEERTLSRLSSKSEGGSKCENESEELWDGGADLKVEIFAGKERGVAAAVAVKQ